MRPVRPGLLAALLLLLCVGCGGAEAPPPEEPHAPPPRPAAEADDGMQVESSRGTISRMAFESAMSANLERLGGCYRQALGAAPWLHGDIVLAFRIARDGSVKWVVPATSTIGHQATEECLLDRARGIRFARPVGGEAEASYPLAFSPGSGRPPDAWSATQVAEALAEHREEIAACGVGGAGWSLTMYVDRGGRVAAAGMAYATAPQAAAATCVARAATAWTMPDPGSWIAKVTLDL